MIFSKYTVTSPMADPITGALMSGLSHEAVLIISIVALAIGLFLAFLGRLVWKPLMSIIGGFIGATLGFVIGLMLGGEIVGLIVAVIGGIIGARLFAAIVEFALAALAGIVAFGLLAIGTGIPILAAVAGIVVFVLCFKFRDKVVGVLMAVVGSLIAGVGLMGLDFGLYLSAIVALVVMIAGSVVQTFIIKGKRAQGPARRCPSCGSAMVNDRDTNLWYCPNCGMGGLPPSP